MSGRAPEASSIEAADSEEEPDAENEALPAAHRTSGHGLTALRTKRRLVNATNRPLTNQKTCRVFHTRVFRSRRRRTFHRGTRRQAMVTSPSIPVAGNMPRLTFLPYVDTLLPRPRRTTWHSNITQNFAPLRTD